MMHQHPHDPKYLETPPDIYDGFGFFKDPLDGQVKFYYFDDQVKLHGEPPKDPTTPTDREAYHVLLQSVRKAIVYMDAPFLSNFIDPFVYAAGLAHAGFSGIMYKKTPWSADVVAQAVAYLRMLHAKTTGYMFTDESGHETFYGANT